ncbi:MAG TPA: tol-pal system protein YbgF [Alphaproteobacteria bacterium]|jgi:tol-pal system protein YbgF
MIRTDPGARRALAQAFLAALFLLPISLSAPAVAETPPGLQSALDTVRREAQSIRVELAQMSTDAAVQLNRRLDELERLIQRLTDKVETLDAQQRDLAREFERYKNDTDFRLNQLDKGKAAPPRRAEAPTPRPPERRAETPPPRTAPPRKAADDDEDETPPRPARRDEAARPQQPDAPAPGGSVRDEYEHALALLRRADYKAAEAALAQFVRRHPNDPLAANAYYWLGENYYAQGRYQDAAYQFADGFRKFPNHPKAQDSLFKLALSLGRQGKTGEACTAFGEFKKRFPNAGLRREAEAEQRRLKCPG